MASQGARLLRVAFVGAALAAVGMAGGACRKWLGGGPQTSTADVEANLEQLIAVTSKGLDLQVSPRFLTFGPLPNETPWTTPAPATQSWQAHGETIRLKAGSDGMVRERYEARPCPLREIWSCVELWATGMFGDDKQLGCIGLRLEKGNTIERQKLQRRAADNCPFMTTAQGPGGQIMRDLEKAQLEHSKRQEPDRYLDPKTP